MVWKEHKNKKTETIEKKGFVLNAEEIRLRNEDVDTKTFRDFGQVDFTDHEIEEAEKRARTEQKDFDDLNSPFDNMGKLWKKKRNLLLLTD